MAIANGIRVAYQLRTEGLLDRMKRAFDSLDLKAPGEFNDGVWNRMGQRFDKLKKRAKTPPGEPSPENTDKPERE